MASKYFTLAILCLLLTCCAQPQATSSDGRPSSTVPVPPSCTQPGQQILSAGDNAILLCVPAGKFTMGADDSDPQAQPNEKPQHQVNLDAFWIDRIEVTNAAYARCVTSGGCPPRPVTRGATGVASLKRMNYYHDAEFANYPVLTYLAEDAKAYCEWAGRRLPTEAEWEKAARGTDGRPFPWGTGKECAKASFFGCTEETTAVDSPLAGASPYGALNMAGNVWEWVADKYAPDYYTNSPSANPTGPADGEGNVRRGGGWRSLSSDLRTTARASGTAHHYFDGQMGFRCALGDRAQ